MKRQINSSLYERLLLSDSEANKEEVLSLAQSSDMIRYPYVFEFPGIPEDKPLLGSDLEKEKEKALVQQMNVLMDIGVLPKKKYEDWRFGQVEFLESVCSVNLRKLSSIMHQMRVYAQKAGLKPSFCCYKQWGTT